MRVTSYQLADRFLIVPNLEHFFGEFRNEENCLDIITTFTFRNVAEIHLTRLGAIAIRFLDEGPLRSIMRLQTPGAGMEPESVMGNHNEIGELQSRRTTFANFIAAALFGRLCAIRHRALSGAQYAGMDEIVGFGVDGGALLMEHSRQADAVIAPKVRFARENPGRVQVIPAADTLDAVAFVGRLAEREDQFEHANLQACMVMNYQAAILHQEQHSAASLALNFSVAEALIQELFLAYGIIGERAPKPFATRQHTVANISARRFRDWRLARRVETLAEGGLLDSYLRQRLDEARALRNDLMHSAAGVSVGQSGTMQTVVRDLWSYFLDDPFELLAAWSMRL